MSRDARIDTGSRRGAGEVGRRRFTGALSLLLLAGLAPLFSPAALAKKKKKKEDEEDGKPKVKLRASSQAGFAPLTIHFTARLVNVEPDDEEFCHAGFFIAERLGRDEHHILAGEDPGCHHPPEERHVSTTFSLTYTVQRQGTYEFFAIVGTNSGRRITSNRVPVRVLASPAGG
jgi:hypothetical protein